MGNGLRITKNEQFGSGAPEEIDVRLRRSRQARRLSLRVSRLDGRVTLTAPEFVPHKEIEAFLQDRSAWVLNHLAEHPAPVVVRPGVRLPVLGKPLEVAAAKVRAPRREKETLWVASERAGAHAVTFLKETARQHLSAACDGFSARLDRTYTQLALRDTRSRWGSCSSTGRLMFSWRLAMAPVRIADYVAAHEVAHLVEMNHSAAFWTLVGKLHPSWEADRAWLRQHGAWLHRYQFEETGR